MFWLMDYEDEIKKLLLLFGACFLLIMFFSCSLNKTKQQPIEKIESGSYDIVVDHDVEVGSYIDGNKVYGVIDVRELKGRYSKSVSIVVEDENGARYNQEYIWEWNTDFQETSYKNLSSLIIGDKVAIIQIDKAWDINNLRRVRIVNN